MSTTNYKPIIIINVVALALAFINCAVEEKLRRDGLVQKSALMCKLLSPRLQIGAYRESLEFVEHIVKLENSSIKTNIKVKSGSLLYDVGAPVYPATFSYVCDVPGIENTYVEFNYLYNQIDLKKLLFTFFFLLSVFLIIYVLTIRIVRTAQASVIRQIDRTLKTIFELNSEINESSTTSFNRMMENLFTGSSVIPDIVKKIHILESDIMAKNSQIISSAYDEHVLQSLRKLVHDLKSPMAAISTVSNTLDDSDAKRILELSSQRALQIINTSLDETRYKLDQKMLSSHNIEKIVDSIKQVIVEKSVTNKSLRLVLNEDIKYSYECYCDIHWLQRIVANLITNSIEASEMSNDKMVTVDVRLNDNNECLCIIVNDKGIGIHPDAIEKILSGQLSTKLSGNGIGVYSAKIKLEEWRAKLILQSEFGCGTTATIQMPIVKQ